MLLLVETALAIGAFRKGWRWQVLWPIAIALALGTGFLLGASAAAGGESIRAATPVALLVDVALIVTLAVMGGRSPAGTAAEGSPAATQPTTPVEAPVHAFDRRAV